jgi:phage shock protein E
MTPFLIALSAALAVMVLMTRLGKTAPAKAHALVQAGARLLDVRTPSEFATGHLAGAINIPLDDLPRRVDELKGKEAPVVVYCRSGARSAAATRVLKSKGLVDVHDLGAMSRW